MPERVSGQPLPSIEIITSDKKRRAGSSVGSTPREARHAGDLVRDDNQDVPIDPRIVQALRDNIAAGRQAIVLVNRRGYAYYLFSLTEQKPVQCPQCSISLTLHARSTVLRCHYCDHQTRVDKILADRPTETFIAVGYGSQKAEDWLAKLLPGARIERLDSDTVVDREHLPRTLTRFRNGELDIMVGTQMLAKGHDFPNVTLIVILEVDQLLGLPDFRAGERTFQLIVQAAGRAGRAELPGQVMIQTMRTSHPVVGAAVAQDFKTFAARELAFRQAHSYPPFARLVAFELNGPDAREILATTARMEAWFEQMALMKPDLLKSVRVLGPAVPPIETIRGRHRRFVILSSAEVEPLRRMAAMFQQAFHKLTGDLRLKIDVDPQSLI
jgi:primosomal protein N' (replication factor Y)